MKKRGLAVVLLIGTLLLLSAGNVLFAQTAPVQVGQMPLLDETTPVLPQPQLESLVSPVALYPDPLLSQVLVASTYPLEIVEAAQWLRRNPSLTGAAAQSAASSQNWDPSIQALVVFPDVLFRMNDDIRWTTDLGNAFLAQQAAVMDAVQHLRTEAMATGKLSSNPQTTVTTEVQGDSNAVEILPTNPAVMYVPEYDPALIWGTDLYPYPYMPYFHYPFGYPYGFIGYGPGIFVGSFFAGWGGWGGWGWRPNWFGHRGVTVNNGFFTRYGYNRFGGIGGLRQPALTTWAHNSVHRANVPYASRALAAQFHSQPRAGMTGRAVMPATAYARPAGGFARPASPGFGSSRPFAGNTFSSGSPRPVGGSRGYGYYTPNRTGPAMSFGGGRSYGSASVMRGGGQSFGRSGGQSFGRSGGGGWGGGHSGGGRSGGHGGHR
jgi:hypothetical protein